MKNAPRYQSPVSIIPGGCPQFLDFTLPGKFFGKEILHFHEKRFTDAEQHRYKNHLICLAENPDSGNYFDQSDGVTTYPEDYSLNVSRAFEPWERLWLPLPFLRTMDQRWSDGAPKFEKGPSNWARGMMYVSQTEEKLAHLVIAFDTAVEDRPKDGDVYHAISKDDVSAHGNFMLATHVRDISWFLNLHWVDEWLAEDYGSYRQKLHKGPGSWRDDNNYYVEHLAAYFTWLTLARRIMCLSGKVSPDLDDKDLDKELEKNPKILMDDLKVQVINPERDLPVEVDLVLDIGNSRTTGILVETMPQRMTDLNDSYLLELRNLHKPDEVYAEPFETRVEFHDAIFGKDILSRRSGREKAFAWPSAVRTGPEAARLNAYAVCAEGTTGMSSPKRYLWDERAWQQTWRYNGCYGVEVNGDPKMKNESMVSRGLFVKQLNPLGTPNDCIRTEAVPGDQFFRASPSLKGQKPGPVFESQFTRSSMMLFMMGEIITQALVTINSPATRGRRELPNLPRRLRRLIFTMPTAMPVAEKRIFRRWVNWAVRVVWKALDWEAYWQERNDRPGGRTASPGDYRISPQVRCDWDEASCSQLVYLYNELVLKQHGDAHHLFRLLGRPRPSVGSNPCVRVASIDIGGGTTDLSITTYELVSGEGATPRMAPHVEFRDGFNIAGDEVVRAVVSGHVVEAVDKALKERGMAHPEGLIVQLFGRDASGMSQEQRVLRGKLARQVAAPVALGMLAASETDAEEMGGTFKLGDFFLPPEAEMNLQAAKSAEAESRPRVALRSRAPQKELLSAVRQTVAAASGIADFDLMDVPITVDPEAIDDTVRGTLTRTISALCEIVNIYDCDVLLLTGRPSTWRAVVSLVLGKLPVPPDRIVSMHRYHVGSWYPFPDVFGRIKDPKTTVVVGAILCMLADGHLQGFSFASEALRLQSTARYIGEINMVSGQMQRPKVWFTVPVEKGDEWEDTKTVEFSGPIVVGYRQLEPERWPTTRYYLLNFSSPEALDRSSGKIPYAVEIDLFVEEEMDDDAPTPVGKDKDRAEGEFTIKSITNAKGETVNTRDLEMRLQTMRLEEGYWLDTGIVKGDG
jgi:hypothetical protein